MSLSHSVSTWQAASLVVSIETHDIINPLVTKILHHQLMFSQLGQVLCDDDLGELRLSGPTVKSLALR